jgi:hypothetical protein
LPTLAPSGTVRVAGCAGCDARGGRRGDGVAVLEFIEAVVGIVIGLVILAAKAALVIALGAYILSVM